jgi:predicted GNAT superfamily acetyltransferase
VLNANLNIVTLGAIVEEYEENVYGESASPLHGGLPTDRFVCQWWIRRPHVERRIARAGQPGHVAVVSHEVARAPVVNETSVRGDWLECGAATLGLDAPRVAVDVPLDFTAMLAGDLDRARRWRAHTREIFNHYFSAGYRVVDFALHEPHHRGRYLLTSIRPPAA